jgi:hypothetical protein
MDGYARLRGIRLYAVEVSGRDRTQDFFVERCDLAWNEDAGRHVVLHQNLRGSAVLIVRLFEAGKAGRSHPSCTRHSFWQARRAETGNFAKPHWFRAETKQ